MKNAYQTYHRGRQTLVWAYGQNEARAKSPPASSAADRAR